jgi:hypothetical protein
MPLFFASVSTPTLKSSHKPQHFIYIIAQYFFIRCFLKCLWSNKCRTCTCMTCSKPMHHPFGNDASHMNLWDAWFLNCLAYFRKLQNGDRCMLSDLYIFFVCDFSSVTLQFSDTPILGVWSENSGVMLLKSLMEDTQGRHYITHDNHYS